jgi:hypothetical protein
VKLALAIVLVLGASAVPALAQPPRHLLVIGDSLAYDNRDDLQARLAGWRIESDFAFARSARETARDLRGHARHGLLPPVIHVSTGTGDDPAQPGRFRRVVRRVMRLAGPHRCVVWANVWRLRLAEPTSATLNLVLAAEDLARPNLHVIDWHAMVEARRDWLVDLVHVNAEGNAARADAVAHEVRRCRAQLAS